ncbi:MAG: hypothetical protein CSA68_10150 [Rhodobacterales bacterium]|nr:MAG: hypothetical protein CSA68_10150 [Rhodobacterales bacterium]
MKRFIAATLLGCASLGLSAPAHATDMLKMSDGERAVFGAEVRAYLLENPEIIIEAVQILEERRAAELANSDHALLLEYADQIYNDGWPAPALRLPPC